MEVKPNFPYKSLIWALFAIIAIFLFRDELKKLITNTEHLSVFGVEIKASPEKANKLLDSIRSFETTVAALSNQLASQQNKIKKLDKLKEELEEDLARCPDAKETSIKFNKQVSKIFDANLSMKAKSDKLSSTSILITQTYDVRLIVPSDMVNAKVFVDGKQAHILERKGTIITVRVTKKKTEHHFELDDGKKRCATKKMITKNAMKFQIDCDS